MIKRKTLKLFSLINDANLEGSNMMNKKYNQFKPNMSDWRYCQLRMSSQNNIQFGLSRISTTTGSEIKPYDCQTGIEKV